MQTGNYIVRIDKATTRYRDNGASVVRQTDGTWQVDLATIHGPGLFNNWSIRTPDDTREEIATLVDQGRRKITQHTFHDDLNYGLKERCDQIGNTNILYQIDHIQVDFEAGNFTEMVTATAPTSYQRGIETVDLSFDNFKRPDPFLAKPKRDACKQMQAFVTAARKNAYVGDCFSKRMNTLEARGQVAPQSDANMAAWLIGTLVDATASNQLVAAGMPAITLTHGTYRCKQLHQGYLVSAHAPLRSPMALAQQISLAAINTGDMTRKAAGLEIVKAMPAILNDMQHQYITGEKSALTSANKQFITNRRQYAGYLMGT